MVLVWLAVEVIQAIQDQEVILGQPVYLVTQAIMVLMDLEATLDQQVIQVVQVDLVVQAIMDLEVIQVLEASPVILEEPDYQVIREDLAEMVNKVQRAQEDILVQQVIQVIVVQPAV